ncbi:hypothetical protein JW911_02740 [Candidatus Peregrinibacteria bacterium]|nr:hypothetical protein [Candidatus Peregrinibacteria bacterium]
MQLTNKLLVFVILTMLFTLTGCIKENTDINDAEPKVITEIPKDKESCEAANGIWGYIGLSPVEQCNLKTSDGGKECKSSDECEGTCLGEIQSLHNSEKLMGKKMKGKCSYVYTIVGCHAFIENGKVDQVICID